MDWAQIGFFSAFVVYGLLLAKPVSRLFVVVARAKKATLAVAMFFCAVATVDADKPSSPVKRLLHRLFNLNETVTQEDVSRGFRLKAETCDVEYSYVMPSDAATLGNWHVHGATSDFGNNRTSLCGIDFPFGPDAATATSAWYSLDASLQFGWGEHARKIVAVGEPLAASPGASRLWRMGDRNSVTFAWENMFFVSCPTACVNAAITLHPNGDFTTRSNDVVRAYRRINPDDWDGDGIANPVDPMPRLAGADCHGTSAGWYNIALGHVLSAAEADDGRVELAWLDEDDEEFYYWFDFAVTGRLDSALVNIKCDGPSELGDMAVMVRPGETARVPLLVGANYEVESAMPFSMAVISDCNAQIATNGACNLRIAYPLDWTLEETPPPNSPPRRLLRSGGGRSKEYRAVSSPRDVHAIIADIQGEYCCPPSTNGVGATWRCSTDCRCCGNAHLLWGTAVWKGYSSEFFVSQSCPCATEDEDENGVSNNLAFSEDAVVFENAYTNAPGDVVGRRSTTVSLEGRVTGGQYGGTLTVMLSDGGRLLRTYENLPAARTIAPGETYSFSVGYEAQHESAAENDITATATFTENMTGRVVSDIASITAVRVELTPEISRTSAVHRHIAGIGEEIAVTVLPSSIEWEIIINGSGVTKLANGKRKYVCPLQAEYNGIDICICSAMNYQPELRVLEPSGVIAMNVWQLLYDEEQLGVAGWSGMTLDLYVTPLSVAFGPIEVAEEPEYGDGIAPTGYFSDSDFMGIWHHTEAVGAGTWRPIRNDNFFMPDVAQIGEALPKTPWEQGEITWRIPTVWRKIPKNDLEYNEPHEFGIPYYQSFRLNECGTLRVSKLNDFWVERDPDSTRRKSAAVGGTL